MKSIKSLPAAASLLGLSIFLMASSIQAGIINTYNDKSSFLTNTSSSSLTGAIPNQGNVSSTETLGDVTFSTTSYSTSTDIYFGQWSTLISGNEIAISGSENMDISINLSSSVLSFGFDFHEPTNINQKIDGTNTPYSHESLFTLELFSGASLIGSTFFDPLSDQLEFFGFTSDIGFDQVRITESLAGQVYQGGLDISNDNEFFGEFYAGASTVPEPSILALMGFGIIGLGLSRRKMKR